MPLVIDAAAETPTPGFGDVDPADLAARAVRLTLEELGVTEAEVSVILMDDDGMAALNRQWKDADGATDVLAFALHEPGEPPLGDVYVGFQRALAQATELGEAPARELARLAIHGTLHVLGWDHPEEDREASEMWQRQERLLDALEVG